METRFPADHPVMNSPALWLADEAADASRTQWAVGLFRQVVHLDEAVRSARIWVTASQRFELFLDGTRIARGPARSDPRRWGVRELVLPDVVAGRHVLAVRVWHAGPFTAKAQMGGPAFFLFATDSEVLQPATEGVSLWRCFRDASRQPHPERAGNARGHISVGVGECFDAAVHPWDWAELDFDDSQWPAAMVVCPRAANPWGNLPLGHDLRPEPIPPMQESPIPAEDAWSRIMAPTGEAIEWSDGDFHIPPHTSKRFILDRSEMVNAYPAVRWSKGRRAEIRLVTCEAPVERGTGLKGHRDAVVGCELPGMVDVIHSDGGEERVWEPLWFRSFRYLEVSVTTADEGLLLESPRLTATRFPLGRSERVEIIATDGRAWDRLLNISRRTAKLCSHETFFDCPHYEQSQFPGDGRIMARYHYVMCDDDRLARKAIDDLHAGRVHSGLLRSHYPSHMEQVISTYSLAWIGMLYDSMIFRGDDMFVSRYLAAAREILGWFVRGRRSDGLAGRCEAPFVDWADGFVAGTPPQGADGGSGVVTAMVAEAATWLAELERRCGYAELAPRWEAEAESLRDAIRRNLWSEAMNMFADTPSQERYSVHMQVQATLAGVVTGDAAAGVLRRALDEPRAVQPGTLYYRWFVAEAMLRAGMLREAEGLLDAWFSLLDGRGLTTWPESDKASPRSDCHGWGVAADLIAVALGKLSIADPSMSGGVALPGTIEV